MSKIREEIESVNGQIQQAQREYNLEKAAELQYGKLPALQKQLAEEEKIVKERELTLVHECVTEDEIGKIVSNGQEFLLQDLMKANVIRLLIWEMNSIRELLDRMRL